MQYLKDKAYIIKRVNSKDSDRFITLFTKDHGKLEVLAKGVRKISSKRASSLEPLNLIEFQAVKSGQYHVLTEVKLVSSQDHLKKELKYIKQVFLVCELINSIMPQGVAHADVFDLILRALPHISKDEKTLIYFQAKLLTLLGFWDHTKSFKNADHVEEYMQQIVEKKLKTPSIFS
jgi:DNA repair protein RecO (recombination protein O)